MQVKENNFTKEMQTKSAKIDKRESKNIKFRGRMSSKVSKRTTSTASNKPAAA